MYAWVKHRILHRDISAGNILIWIDDNKKVVAKLADWDLAKSQDELDRGPALPWRSVSGPIIEGFDLLKARREHGNSFRRYLPPPTKLIPRQMISNPLCTSLVGWYSPTSRTGCLMIVPR